MKKLNKAIYILSSIFCAYLSLSMLTFLGLSNWNYEKIKEINRFAFIFVQLILPTILSLIMVILSSIKIRSLVSENKKFVWMNWNNQYWTLLLFEDCLFLLFVLCGYAFLMPWPFWNFIETYYDIEIGVVFCCAGTLLSRISLYKAKRI